jgi:hypothetical protein
MVGQIETSRCKYLLGQVPEGWGTARSDQIIGRLHRLQHQGHGLPTYVHSAPVTSDVQIAHLDCGLVACLDCPHTLDGLRGYELLGPDCPVMLSKDAGAGEHAVSLALGSHLPVGARLGVCRP